MQETTDAKDYPQWKNAIGIAVRQQRKRIKRPLENAAILAQISPDLLRSIENGRGHLTLQQLYRLSHALDIPMSQLLGTKPAPATGNARDFMDAFHQIKDPELKDRISSLVNTLVAPLGEDVPKTRSALGIARPAHKSSPRARLILQLLIEWVLIARYSYANSLST